MKFPKKIHVAGQDFNVKLVGFRENDNAGTYHSHFHEIQVNTESGPESSHAETFLHELIELVNDMAALKLPHKKINDLSQWLFMIMRDNKIYFGK